MAFALSRIGRISQFINLPSIGTWDFRRGLSNIMASYFVTVMLNYERTEKTIPGPAGPLEEEKFGWAIRINGIADYNLSKEDISDLQRDFNDFVLKDGQLELTSFEENKLSYDCHDQFHPPMTLVTRILDKIVRRGYRNASCSMTAEKNEVTYCLWNFEKRCELYET